MISSLAEKKKELIKQTHIENEKMWVQKGKKKKEKKTGKRTGGLSYA
jgi:hypothetical protein